MSALGDATRRVHGGAPTPGGAITLCGRRDDSRSKSRSRRGRLQAFVSKFPGLVRELRDEFLSFQDEFLSFMTFSRSFMTFSLSFMTSSRTFMPRPLFFVASFRRAPGVGSCSQLGFFAPGS